MRRRMRVLGMLAVVLVTAGWLSLAAAQGLRELVIAQGIDIPGFDVHNHNTTAVEAIHVNLFDYLVFRSPDGAFEPALATSWERVSDTAMRFMLREGVRWHDGAPFTAEDVKFTLERVANDSSLREYGSYRQIREVEIVGPHEIVIHTHNPEPVLLGRLSRIGSSMLPKHHIEAIGWEAFNTDPIGTGPFKFVEWRRDDRLILEANDDHWRGRPVWDRLVHRRIPEDSTRVAELLTGGVHIATNVPVQDAPRVEAAAGVHIAPWLTPRVMLYLVNTAEGVPTADRRVREAIDYAIDNQLLIDALMEGLGTPTRGRVSPGITAAPMELYDDYVYDPERAVQLLAEAGYGPGELTIVLEGPAGRYTKDSEIIELTAVMLEAVGVNVSMQVLEWSAYLSRVWDADNVENLGLIGLGNSLFDAALAYQSITCSGSYAGKTNWCDADFDALVNEALVELDPDRRADLYREIYDIVAEERIMIFLFNVEAMVGVSDSVAWSPRADELLWMFEASPVD
jgi:peptide/nickel transport system substrate-binding protein